MVGITSRMDTGGFTVWGAILMSKKKQNRKTRSHGGITFCSLATKTRAKGWASIEDFKKSKVCRGRGVPGPSSSALDSDARPLRRGTQVERGDPE